MYDGTKSLITGVARGALKGFMVGLGIMGALAVASMPFALSLTMLIPMAATFILGAVGALTIPGIAFGAVVMGSALIGAIYKGVSEYVDTEETVMEKEDLVHLNKISAAIKHKQDRELATRAPYKPQESPEGVAADELPQGWKRESKQRRGGNDAAPDVNTGQAPSAQTDALPAPREAELAEASIEAPRKVIADLPQEKRFTDQIPSRANQSVETRFSNTTLSSPLR